jgi:hypothetical protein
VFTKKSTVGLFTILILTTLACTININGRNFGPLEVGELRTESQMVSGGKAETVAATIEMNAGELHLAAAEGEALMEAQFSYNIDSWTPQVDYAVDDGLGNLSIQQPAFQFDGFPTDEMRNSWDIRLNDNIPLNLDLKIGAGTSQLDLQALDLETLRVRAGAGETTINLAGSSLPNLIVDGGVGAMTINLGGTWENDLQATIRNGIGDLRIMLPQDVGVRVNVSQGITDVVIDGLVKEGQVYVNEAYGQSPVTLNIDLEGGIGQITLGQQAG